LKKDKQKSRTYIGCWIHYTSWSNPKGLSFVMAACQLWLAAGHYILLLSFRSSFFSFFRRLISEVAWPIVTKLCHMVDGDPYL